MLKAGFVLDGKYRIIELAGKGGTSFVYRAVHERLQNEWAVKEIRKETCDNFSFFRRRLIAEADLLKKLRHPGLPGIIDIIEESGAVYIIMEFIHGKTLKELVYEKGNYSEKETVDILLQVCDVLNYLHSQKPPIIYRDLKPANLMIEDGKVKLIDFGTAREYSYGKTGGDTVSLGTRGYAAPEQYGGMGQTDARTDIYCLGVTGFFLMTGRSPDRPPYQLCPVRQINPWLSEGIEDIILRCTEGDPDKRFQNCRDLMGALKHIDEFAIEYRKTERRKIVWFLFLMVMSVMSAASWKAFGKKAEEERKLLIRKYVERAERTITRKDAGKHWAAAVRFAPESRYVYNHMLSYYADTNHFTMEDAAELISIIEEPAAGTSAIDCFRNKDTAGWAEFNYKTGLAFFYDMGGITGKKEAEKWFQQVKHTDRGLDRERRKRAAIYEKICRCYRTFLAGGEDRSGEKQTEGYQDFFLALQDLNHFKLDEKSPKSDVAAAYMISVEVGMDIRTYAEPFIYEADIEAGALHKELEIIRKYTDKGMEGRIIFLERYKSSQEMAKLAEILDDAVEKIDLIVEKGGQIHDEFYGKQCCRIL